MRWLCRMVAIVLPFCIPLLAATFYAETEPVPHNNEQRPPWQMLAPFFEPPPEFRNQFGSYRSPLQFVDGTFVKTAADWSRRREEILNQWQKVMGPWPSLLQKPQIEFLARTHRDNFTQNRIRIEIGPGETGEGWLLVPDGNQ